VRGVGAAQLAIATTCGPSQAFSVPIQSFRGKSNPKQPDMLDRVRYAWRGRIVPWAGLVKCLGARAVVFVLRSSA